MIARIPLHLAAADTWGLGGIFFYMLSGYHPFSDALSTSENAIVRGFLLVQFVFLKLFSILIIGLFPRSFSIGKKFRFRIG